MSYSIRSDLPVPPVGAGDFVSQSRRMLLRRPKKYPCSSLVRLPQVYPDDYDSDVKVFFSDFVRSVNNFRARKRAMPFGRTLPCEFILLLIDVLLALESWKFESDFVLPGGLDQCPVELFKNWGKDELTLRAWVLRSHIQCGIMLVRPRSFPTNLLLHPLREPFKEQSDRFFLAWIKSLSCEELPEYLRDLLPLSTSGCEAEHVPTSNGAPSESGRCKHHPWITWKLAHPSRAPVS